MAIVAAHAAEARRRRRSDAHRSTLSMRTFHLNPAGRPFAAPQPERLEDAEDGLRLRFGGHDGTHHRHGFSRAGRPPPRESSVRMTMAEIRPREVRVGASGMSGLLRVPTSARGLVAFAHGSGSSRFSRRNNFVAAALGRVRLATLLFDLLSDAEADDRRNVFDIALLGSRMVEAIDWAATEPSVAALPIGLFGASTGAAAALVAAVERPAPVFAVVSRGGRPDLAAECLPRVHAPTLLIVGGADYGVIELNRDAAALLRCEHSVAIVPGATHLFEEHGALEEVVDRAARWFLDHLPADPGPRPPRS
ncbi:MAG: DUF3175 domain-containing protein [Proteobacteria bacterium]|nr:DUF3175 domain-containing protein [Pseudomonadota bacterium]